MKSLLLIAILSVLVTVLQAQDDLPFLSEDKNVSGIWYRTAIVMEGHENITELKDMTQETSFPFVVRHMEMGKLQVITVEKFGGRCMPVVFTMEKTEKPGQYRAFFGTILMYIYELPVMDNYVLYSECQYFDDKFYAAELLGKDPKENPEALEEFKKLTKMKGFSEKNIILLEQKEMCVPEAHDVISQECKS